MNKNISQGVIKKLNRKGFTIIELLIATTIFSVILLVVTFGILNIGKIYYRGINSSNTQSVARSISDEIVQAIQFNGGEIKVSNPGFFCLGEKKYSYVLNKQVGTDPGKIKHALIVEIDPGCAASSLDSNGEILPALAPTIEYRDLIGKNMRLSKIDIIGAGGSANYQVRVGIIAGEDDLIVDAEGDNFGSGDFDQTTMRCRLGAGSQFCSVSELYTIANKRI